MADAGDHPDQFEALAEFLAEAEPFLRRHIRGLRGRTHPLLSTSELQSAVVERMVRIEAGGTPPRSDRPAVPPPLEGSTERFRQRWALLLLVARRTVSDARHLVARTRRNLEPPAISELPQLSDEELREVRGRIDSLLASLDPVDRHLIQLRIRGQSWKAVAGCIGLEEAACRQRWVRVLKDLQKRYGN